MKALVWPLLVFWSVSTPIIAAEFPAIPGQRYDVGGYQLHINCTGSGSPTVLVDVGLGDDSTDWLPIQQAISQNSRICIFDRAGYGWSSCPSTIGLTIISTRRFNCRPASVSFVARGSSSPRPIGTRRSFSTPRDAK